MGRLSRLRETQSAATHVKKGDDLTMKIQAAQNDFRARRWHDMGQMVNLMLGPDDNAAYATERDVRERVASLSKVRGLMLDWPQSCQPRIAYTADKTGLIFPFGCPKPPNVSDPREPGATGKKIAQNIIDYASGYIEGVDGSKYIVLQPVLYIGLWIEAGLYSFVAYPDPISGKYPALLMHPRRDRTEAMIVHGIFQLQTARAGGGEAMPWEKPAA